MRFRTAKSVAPICQKWWNDGTPVTSADRGMVENTLLRILLHLAVMAIATAGQYARSRRKFVGFFDFELFQRSDQLHIFGTRTLRSTPFGERHLFAFSEVVVAHPFEARIVEEQIFVRSCVNKSEALVRQFLNRTFSHFVQLPQKISLRRCPKQTRSGHSTASDYCTGQIDYFIGQRVWRECGLGVNPLDSRRKSRPDMHIGLPPVPPDGYLGHSEGCCERRTYRSGHRSYQTRATTSPAHRSGTACRQALPRNHTSTAVRCDASFPGRCDVRRRHNCQSTGSDLAPTARPRKRGIR
mgnify:CR=1 FL=1